MKLDKYISDKDWALISNACDERKARLLTAISKGDAMGACEELWQREVNSLETIMDHIGQAKAANNYTN